MTLGLTAKPEMDFGLLLLLKHCLRVYNIVKASGWPDIYKPENTLVPSSIPRSHQ